MWDHLIKWVIELDKNVFVFINSSMHKSWLDGFMLLMRNPYTWVPLYVLLLFKIYKTSPGILLPFVIASLACFAITDFTSASIIKPLVGRLRPCYDTSLQNNIYILTGCGGKYSFPSSHASNHFGLAMVWYRIIFFLRKEKWIWVWYWAAIICFAQVYVGKHFPLDILGGALLGMAAGTLIAMGFKYWYKNKESIFKLARFRQQNPLNGANKNV